MKNVLLITDFYDPQPSANGLCVKEIAKCYKQNGHNVHVLSFGIYDELTEKIDGITVHKMMAPKFYLIREHYKNNESSAFQWSLARIIRKIKVILLFFIYPMCFPIFCEKYLKKAKKLIKTESIDTVIAEYVPFEAAYVGYRIKKLFDIKCILYVVDTFTQGINEQKYKIFGYFSSMWEIRFLKRYDLFLSLINFKGYYGCKRFCEYEKKIKYVGVPFLKLDDYECQNNNNPITIIYTGSWGNDRNPSDFFNLLNNINKVKKIKFIYCGYKNDTTDWLCEKYRFIEDKGYVKKDDINFLISQAGFLLNLGNDTNTIPSKIIDYISTGKPIIHIYKSELDPCLSLLTEYGNCILINSKEYNELDLMNFLESNFSVRINKRIIQDKFKVFLPIYTFKICEGEL